MSLSADPVRLIAVDLDGTLLRSDGSLSERARDSLHRASRSGIVVVPATGRPEAVCGDIIRSLGLDGYWVFANGAITKDLGRQITVRADWIDEGAARRLIGRIRRSVDGVGLAVNLEDGLVYEPGLERLVPNPPPFPSVSDVLDHLAGRVQKLLVFGREGQSDRLHDEVQAAVGDGGVVHHSGLAFVEVAVRLVTKATALDALCDDLGIDPIDAAVFGDNHNDISMLEWAGHSYAMANSMADVIAAADRVIGSNDSNALADEVDSLVDRGTSC